MIDATELVFVYNADSGLFDRLTDAAHKALSPSTYACTLCKITYGLLTEKRAWQRFVTELPMPCRFLHRDEFQQRFPALPIPLPAALRIAADGTPAVCIDAEALNRCDDLEGLMALVRRNCVDGAAPV